MLIDNARRFVFFPFPSLRVERVAVHRVRWEMRLDNGSVVSSPLISQQTGAAVVASDEFV